ncbi:MAG: twin-arginine translocation signal domain-containing protein [Desulfobacterales bacterium]|nr:twin-arginine translocation signal domain-containing protein [Desulfobacterales bacterium]
MKKNRTITRRDFLRGTAYTAFAAALGPSLSGETKAEEKVKVVLIRDENAIDQQGNINQKIVQKMFDQGTCELLGEENPIQAWKKLIKPADVVGIKSNSWFNLPTPGELEEAIQQRIMDIGVPKKSIAIDDRGILNNPIFRSSTALINVRPLRTHHWSGIGGCIKNYIMFVSSPWAYHGDACSPLASIWNQPTVKGKTRLNILSLIRTQFYNRGANHFDRRFVSEYKGLLIGQDPVALDAVGARLLQLQRIAHFGEDRSLDTTPKHIFVADEKYKLGVSDLRRIEVVKLGWLEGALI